jgi:TrpR family trp operon transcriptional repressor
MLKNIETLVEFLAKTDDPKKIKKLLNAILTPAELKDLASRWEIVKLLDQGMTQRSIAQKLHVSLCKITRGSRELKKNNSILKKVLHNKEQQT